jgi:arsenate reductase
VEVSLETFCVRRGFRQGPDPEGEPEAKMNKAADRRRPFKILFLCTGNSARSILAEFLIRRIGQGRFESFSAGTNPTGRVNPFALRVLHDLYHIDASDARSKTTEGYQETNFDFVITVCDNARETCPVWPGQPIVAHWGLPDPALAAGTDEQIFREFKQAALQLQRRIELFCSLPFDKLDRLKLARLTRDIGNQ